MGTEQSRQESAQRRDGRNMSEGELQRILERQRKMYEENQRRLLQQISQQANNNTPQTTPSSERIQTPYNFAREELTNPRDSVNRNNLYPNISNVGANTANANIQAQSTPQKNLAASNNRSGNEPGFVFINSPQAPRQRTTPPTPATYDITSRTRPTAPPAPLATATYDSASWSTPSTPPAFSDRDNRTRSSSTSRSQSRNTDEDLLKCPLCNNDLGITIYQCRNGHSACNTCKVNSRLCKMCPAPSPITDTRNHALEAYIGERMVPCHNTSEGCRLHFKLVDMEMHLKECLFSDMECPLAAIFGRCYWRGKISQMEFHFDEFHSQHREADVDKEMLLYNIRDTTQIIHFVKLGVFNFLVHVHVSSQDSNIYLTVRHLGTKISSNKWSYEFHVYDKSQPRRKYQYSDVCHSSATRIEDIMKEMSCAVLPISYANSFNSRGSVAYKFFIKKNFEGNRDFPKNNRGRGRGRIYPREFISKNKNS